MPAPAIYTTGELVGPPTNSCTGQSSLPVINPITGIDTNPCSPTYNVKFGASLLPPNLANAPSSLAALRASNEPTTDKINDVDIVLPLPSVPLERLITNPATYTLKPAYTSALNLSFALRRNPSILIYNQVLYAYSNYSKSHSVLPVSWSYFLSLDDIRTPNEKLNSAVSLVAFKYLISSSWVSGVNADVKVGTSTSNPYTLFGLPVP